MKDSYINFLSHFDIDHEELIDYGVNQDTIYPCPESIQQDWENLTLAVLNNKKAYIRGYGRDAHGTNLFKSFYKILLKNESIIKDPSNNSKPTQLLEKITNYSKTKIAKNSIKNPIRNYQVSHIWGRTKNPFLFTAPWNIVWKPKILDPFTGHESKGELSKKYKAAFILKAQEKYRRYIKEYNEIMANHFPVGEIEKAFSQIEKEVLDKQVFLKFKKEALIQIKPIEILEQ